MKPRRRLKKRMLGLSIVALGLVFLLIPLQSIAFNYVSGARRLAQYQAKAGQLDEAEINTLRAQAAAYNRRLDGSADGAVDPFDGADYVTASPLEWPENEAFGFISIPRIDEYLPLYLGASNDHLDRGAAQIDGTNLPLGGSGTRAVIAGHRGMVDKAGFLYIDRLVPGDRILVYALGETLVYEVYGSEDIWPSEYGKLAVIPGQDTLTLLTCTPYPLNTQRLLVNAVRVPPHADEPPGAANEAAAGTPGVTTRGGSGPETAVATMAAETDGAVDRGILLRKYALIAVVAVVWLSLIVIVVLLIRTVRRYSRAGAA